MTLESEIEKIIVRLKELYEENYDIRSEQQIIDLHKAIQAMEKVLNG